MKLGDLMVLSVFGLFGFLLRVCEWATDPRVLSFDDLYKYCDAQGFFKVVEDLGYVTVAYDGTKSPCPFDPSKKNGNRHQMLGLITFLASCCANESAIVTTPHERGGEFVVTFKRVATDCVQYTTDSGKVVKFYFDGEKKCQSFAAPK